MRTHRIFVLIVLQTIISACSSAVSIGDKYDNVKRGDKALLITANMPVNSDISFLFLDYPESEAQKISAKNTYKFADNSELVVASGRQKFKIVCVGSEYFSFSNPFEIQIEGGGIYALESDQNTSEPCQFRIKKIGSATTAESIPAL